RRDPARLVEVERERHVEREAGRELPPESHLEARHRCALLARTSLATSAPAASSTQRIARRQTSSAPRDWISWKTATGSVRVSPSTLPARTIVAPNSPTLRANARTAPASSPFFASGS